VTRGIPWAVGIVTGTVPVPADATAEDARIAQAVADVLADPVRYPLAATVLWKPECLRCDSRRPGAYRPSPVDGVERRGRTMERRGPGLWRCPACGVEEARTSQWEAVRDALAWKGDEVVLLGGNRSGKTATGAILGSLVARGWADPEVRIFLARNGLGAGRLPRDPAPVFVIGITAGDSVDIQRPKYDSLKADGWQWRGQHGQNDATLGPPGVAATKDGTVNFRAAEPGAQSLQGFSAELIHHDEDHGDAMVWSETGTRVADRGGWQLLTATPTRGWTPLLETLLRSETPRPKPLLLRLDALDNPHVNRRALEVTFSKETPLRQRMRRMGEVVALEGLVHPTWDRARHLIPPQPLPADALRVMSIDWGVRDPFAALWGALVGETLHIYRGRYETGRGLTEHAKAIHRAEACPACWREDIDPRSDAMGLRLLDGCPVCRDRHPGLREPEPCRVADPSGATQRQEFAAMMLQCKEAENNRAVGWQTIEERLQPDADGRVGLVVHDTQDLRPLVKELENLRWQEDDASGSARSQMRTQGADHAWDALRYLVMEVARLTR